MKLFERRTPGGAMIIKQCISCNEYTGSFTPSGCMRKSCNRHILEDESDRKNQMSKLTDDFTRHRNTLFRIGVTQPEIEEVWEWLHTTITRLERERNDVEKEQKATRKELINLMKKHYHAPSANVEDYYEMLCDATIAVARAEIEKEKLREPTPS